MEPRRLIDRRLFVMVLVLEAPGSPAWAQGTGTASTTDTRWDALLPPDWDPRKAYRGMELGALNDANPAVLARMRAAQAPLAEAPVNLKMNGAAVRLAGYVVPLDEVGGDLTEFLLVPTFGACIHVAAPPANQIVHILLARPMRGVRMMDAVRVSGTLQALPTATDLGASGWQMRMPVVEPYKGQILP